MKQVIFLACDQIENAKEFVELSQDLKAFPEYVEKAVGKFMFLVSFINYA